MRCDICISKACEQPCTLFFINGQSCKQPCVLIPLIVSSLNKELCKRVHCVLCCAREKDSFFFHSFSLYYTLRNKHLSFWSIGNEENKSSSKLDVLSRCENPRYNIYWIGCSSFSFKTLRGKIIILFPWSIFMSCYKKSNCNNLNTLYQRHLIIFIIMFCNL